MLTPAQSRVVAMVATGAQNGDIATALGITEATVKAHVWASMTKLKVRNRVELALWWVRERVRAGVAESLVGAELPPAIVELVTGAVERLFHSTG